MFLLQIWPVQVDPDRDEEVHMFFARGERWRRLRSIANPAFSTCKMRLVSNLSLCLSVSVCLSVSCLSPPFTTLPPSMLPLFLISIYY